MENYSALKAVFKYFSATGTESSDVFNMGMLSFTDLCQVLRRSMRCIVV